MLIVIKMKLTTLLTLMNYVIKNYKQEGRDYYFSSIY